MTAMSGALVAVYLFSIVEPTWEYNLKVVISFLTHE